MNRTTLTRPRSARDKADARARQKANRHELSERLERVIATGAGRTIRELADWSAADVARVLGVDPGAVHNWEAGISAPQGVVARTYVRLLEVLHRRERGNG